MSETPTPHHSFVVLLALLMIPLTTGSGTTATETIQTADETCASTCPYHVYTAGPGLVVGQTGHHAAACPTGCDLTGDGRPEIEPIGSVHMYAQGTYHNAFVTTSDDLWGTNTALRACLLDDTGACQDDGEGNTDWICGGPTVILDSPTGSNGVAAFLVTLRVTQGLEVCGGTAGTAAVTWW